MSSRFTVLQINKSIANLKGRTGELEAGESERPVQRTQTRNTIIT